MIVGVAVGLPLVGTAVGVGVLRGGVRLHRGVDNGVDCILLRLLWLEYGLIGRIDVRPDLRVQVVHMRRKAVVNGRNKVYADCDDDQQWDG